MSTQVQDKQSAAVHDSRRFWRTLLAFVVPVPWLAKGIQYIVMEPSYEHTADQIRYDVHHDVYRYVQWLDLLFVVLVIPSILAMVLVSRRGAPRLATAAAVLMGGGFLMALPLNIGTDALSWVAAQKSYDPAVIGPYIDDATADPRAGVGVLGFVVAVIFGSILIALALRKSAAVPGWAAALIGFGGATHIFIAGLGHVIHGAGLVVLAVGCLGVSARLLQMSDDEFDVPPREATPNPTP
ncbi:MAG: hypothetical protein ACJ72L_04945 [Marmoricola sp.]